MQAVCTCFLHEIPLAPNSVYVNRMGSNFVTAPNVRSGLIMVWFGNVRFS